MSVVSRYYWLLLPLFFYSASIYATFADITGTYSGTVSIFENGCAVSGGPFTDSVSMAITVESFDSGSGSFSGSGSDSDGSTISFSGILNSSGTVINSSVTVNRPDPGVTQGDINGSSFSSDATQLNLDFSGSDTSGFGGDLCSIVTANGTLARIAGGGIVTNPAFSPSTTLTAPLLLNTQVKTVTTNLGTRIGDVVRGINPGLQRTATGFQYSTGPAGLSAGGLPSGYGAWAGYSYADYDNDLASTAFDGHTHTVLAGLDFAPWDSSVLGLALGYERSDIDTTFNRGNQETDGFTVAPYFGWLLNDFLSLDISLGWSWTDSDQFRTAPGTSTRINSSPDGDRWFGMFNLNGVTTWNNWILGARTGFLVAKNTTDAFVESNGTAVAEVDSRLGQWNIGGDVAYSLGDWEPFARLSYEYDYNLTEITVVSGGPRPANDRDNFVVGAGVRYFNANGWTGNLEWNRRLGREDFDEDVLSFTLRGEW